MSVNVGQLQSTSTFTDMFNGQLDTLQHIEEVDRTNEPIHAQVNSSFKSVFFFLKSSGLIDQAACRMANFE